MHSTVLAAVVENWAQAAKVTLDPELRRTIEDGFPNDDAFDAAVGLFGMLEVLTNRRGAGEPDEGSGDRGHLTKRKLESWRDGFSVKNCHSLGASSRPR